MTKKTFKKKDYRAYNMEADTLVSNHNDDKNMLKDISPKNIIRWEHKDRLPDEMGDIEDLKHSIKTNGQQTPCIVRKTSQAGIYELIAGERRWKALSELNQPAICIVQELDDKDASIIQAIENEKREGLSDYARAMSFHTKIELGILTKKDFFGLPHVSDFHISRLLSFT